ncbi:MAG: glycosyltransferase family 39 protein [Candidatus Aenigmarchaeota archaeon]|nr:glycosyltransferase family 39 protein [Candidatus Aenigmarchaeota archaeon]
MKLHAKNLIVPILLLLIIVIVGYSRLPARTDVIADYDPWFFYRISEVLWKNNMKMPEWDLLSFFPPGRPFPKTLGYEYFVVIAYKIQSIFFNMEFMKFATYIPIIMSVMSVIPAYFLGKELSNEWGGLATALFIAMSPTFIVVSMGSYMDTDTVVVFYSLLSIFTIFLAMKKKTIPFIAIAILANMAFIYSWWFGWYITTFFLAYIPGFILFRFIESYLRKGRFSSLGSIINELKPMLTPLLSIIIILNVVMFLLGFGTFVDFILGASGFRSGGESLLVNVSVAELQPINIFTKEGFKQVANRVGEFPILLTLFGIPFFVILKFVKKEPVNFEEIFLFMWAAFTFYTILSGVRFSLLFAIAVATSAGYVIGNIIKYFEGSSVVLKSSVYGLLFFFTFLFLSSTLSFALNVGSMGVGGNWLDMLNWLKANADKDAIVSTWWDPGHIIAGYTGLRVHADGAHCGVAECVPYNHNIRIQDMGKILSTSNETEAVSLLKKYMQLSPEQCQEAKDYYKKTFKIDIPEESCKPASEMYFISSADLIGKYTWLNYFGGYRAPVKTPYDFQKTPGICCASTPKTEEGQVSCGEFASQERGVWVWCPWIFQISNIQKDRDGNNVFIYDYSGIKITIIDKQGSIIPIYNNKYLISKIMLYDQNGQPRLFDISNSSSSLEKIGGLLWVQPDYRVLIYLPPEVENSMFIRTFLFNGQGLEHFKLVYSNPEIKLYKIDFN